MNINELSDMSAKIDTKGSEEIKKSKAKKIIIAVILLLLIAGIAFLGYFIYCKQNEKKYADPFIDNPKLALLSNSNEDINDLYSFNDTQEPIIYTATKGSFPKYEPFLIQAQATQGTVVSETNELKSTYTISVIYQLTFQREPGFLVWVDEIEPSKEMNAISEPTVTSNIRITSDGEFISGEVIKISDESKYSQEDTKAFFEKYKDEIKKMQQKLYGFFGEDNFVKTQ